MCAAASASGSFFYGAINALYYAGCPLITKYVARKYPNAPTSAVSEELVRNMKQVSSEAFPLYVTVALLTDLFLIKGWSMACDSIEECGGPARSAVMCAAYFFSLEAIIFFDHYYLLHKWDIGKRLGQHAFHHVYKYADQLNAYAGFAFMPQDGWSQGMALPLCTLFIPVPVPFVYLMEVLTGLWTLYIHTDIAPLPWPLMGCDYHYIHHRYNWYNFGFMTVLFDTMFKTVKHPKQDALALSRGLKPMSDSDKRRSSDLSRAILERRGADALGADDASEAKRGKAQ